jgi:hypothetical protein
MKYLLPVMFLATLISPPALADETLKLYPGFVTKLQCEGRLLVSAVGDDNLVHLEPLPKELGCGVLLKPLIGAHHESRSTNLLLETSTGTIRRMISIAGPSETPKSQELNRSSKGDKI